MGKVLIDGVYVDRKITILMKKFKWKGLNNITITFKPSHTLYYDPRKEYVDPALQTENKLSLDEVTNIADKIQNTNVDKIYSLNMVID